jgi:hypothetical protein
MIQDAKIDLKGVGVKICQGSCQLMWPKKKKAGCDATDRFF